MAEKYKIDFMEISAKNKEDINKLFMNGLNYINEHKEI